MRYNMKRMIHKERKVIWGEIMKKKFALVLALGMMFIMTACGAGDNDNQVNVMVEKLDLSTITTDIPEYVAVSAESAVVKSSNTEVDEAINTYLEKENQAFLADIDSIVQAASDFQQASGLLGEEFYFADELKVRDIFVNGDVLSIVMEKYNYLGGAHGASYRYAYNFDLTDGHLLSWDDISADGEALRDKMHKYIVSLVNSDQYSDNQVYYFFDNYENDLDNSLADRTWYIADGELKAIYNQYEIAPYAAGIIEFGMPLGNVVDLALSCESEHTGAGCLSIAWENELANPTIVADVADDDTMGIMLTAGKTIHNVKVYTVSDFYENTVYIDELLGYVEQLNNKETIRVKAMLMGAIPNLVVEYETNGETLQYFAVESGEDGSLSLATAEDMGLKINRD